MHQWMHLIAESEDEKVAERLGEVRLAAFSRKLLLELIQRLASLASEASDGP